MDYTLAQVSTFLAAETRRERERMSLLLVVSAVASQGDKRAIERLQRELERED
ncbi:hypothetical protein AGMMS50225_06680 [Betaproteobacteria bacterium]|nr:hypothetical protein AGMMS50225_06680 [Betaproteobacteria bacterium]